MPLYNSPSYQKENYSSYCNDIFTKISKISNDDNQQILKEIQNLHIELQEIKSELSFIKNSLGDHFLVKGKWIHIDHFKPIFLGKDD